MTDEPTKNPQPTVEDTKTVTDSVRQPEPAVNDVTTAEPEVIADIPVTVVSPTAHPVNIVQEEDLVKINTITEDQANYAPPRGAMLFVTLMGLFYVIYWIISYIEIFVVRGQW